MWNGRPPALAIIGVGVTDTTMQPAWEAISSSLVSQIKIDWWPPSIGGKTADLLPSTSHAYLIDGLLAGTAYSISLVYDVVGGYQSFGATAHVTTNGNQPPPPHLPHLPMPNLVGETLAAAKTQIAALGLQLGYVDNPRLGADYAVVVISQNPAAGVFVTTGTQVDLSVQPKTTVGFLGVRVTNQNADGRPIDVFLIASTTPNIAQPSGTLAINESKTITFPNTGRSYQIVAVDTGLIGCPGDQPFNQVCQRSVTPPLSCTQPGLVYAWSVP